MVCSVFNWKLQEMQLNIQNKHLFAAQKKYKGYKEVKYLPFQLYISLL